VPTAGLNGIEVFYQEVGGPAADALLLIMGWGGDHTAWAFQTPVFAGRFRVVALDNRGAGQSSSPDAPFTIADMADDAVALLDHLGIRRAHVAGASMGGMIAQEIALRHADRVRTLQLHCTLARPDAYGSFLVDTLLKVKARGDREEYARAVLPWILSRKTLAEKADFVKLLLERAVTYPHATGLVGLTRQAEAIGRHDTLARLHQIRVPTLITVGAADILVPPRFSHEIHGHIPHARFVTIPDAGHLHFMEEFEHFNSACLAFLQEHAAA
jgi:pimeloyl-ACP methyl ester carboxylesterase